MFWINRRIIASAAVRCSKWSLFARYFGVAKYSRALFWMQRTLANSAFCRALPEKRPCFRRRSHKERQ